MDPAAEIRRLYYATSKATIQRDLERAIDLLKAMHSDEERERAAVYMDGLSQMRSEWGVRPGTPKRTTESGSGGSRAAPTTPRRHGGGR